MKPIQIISSTQISPADDQVAAEWKLPLSIEWAPAGTHEINASVGGKAERVTVKTDAQDALSLDRELQALLKDASTGTRSRPFIDFAHDGKEAAAIPKRFYWDNGIRLELEWTSAGKAAVEGRTFSYFSPEFLLGKDGHPRGLPTPGPIGALVNSPAFQRIERLAAANTENQKTMSPLLKAAIEKGYVPTGVENEEAAAEHFLEKVQASSKIAAEMAKLTAKVGEFERAEQARETQRKQEAEEEADKLIAAGFNPERRDWLVKNLLENHEETLEIVEAGLSRKDDKSVKGTSRKTDQDEARSKGSRGEKPVGVGSFSYGSVTEEEDRIRSEQNPDRKRVMRAEWYSREQSRHLKAANTIDAALVVPIVQEAVITKLGVALAPLNAFGLMFTTAPLAPKIPQVVTIASASPDSVLRNATNFDQTFTTLAAKTVTPVQLTMPWELTNANIQDGLVMTKMAEANVIALAEAIMNEAIATIDATNYPGTQVTDKISLWSVSGVKNAFVVVANGRTRNLIVAPEIFAQIMHVDSKSFVLTPAQQGAGAWGFNGIWFHNDWARTTSPVAGLKGFVCDPQALVGIIGPPLLAPGASSAGLTTATAIAPGAGVAVQFNSWFSTGSRTPRMSYDVVIGTTVGDSTAGHLVIPAAEVLVTGEAVAAAKTQHK